MIVLNLVRSKNSGYKSLPIQMWEWEIKRKQTNLLIRQNECIHPNFIHSAELVDVIASRISREMRKQKNNVRLKRYKISINLKVDWSIDLNQKSLLLQSNFWPFLICSFHKLSLLCIHTHTHSCFNLIVPNCYLWKLFIHTYTTNY